MMFHCMVRSFLMKASIPLSIYKKIVELIIISLNITVKLLTVSCDGTLSLVRIHANTDLPRRMSWQE